MRNRSWTAALVCLLLVDLSAIAFGQRQSTLIGILEDTPGLREGESHYRDVRVVFRREEKVWVAFPSNCPDQDCLKTIGKQFPAEVKWTIVFDGKNIGQVMSRTPPSYEYYLGVGQQDIVGGAAPPTIGPRSAKFGGFLEEPVYRPLVAVSQPNSRDPENWKPAQLSAEVTAVLRKAFRKKYPKVENCTKQDIEHAKPWRYSDANITVPKAYRSKLGWFLVEVLLSGSECDYSADQPFSPQWFVITPEKQVRFLGSNMWLVDAGDYDNDGSSELVFSIDDYNRGGYKLFYDEFRKKAVFEFSYH